MYLVSDARIREAARLLGRLGRRGYPPTDDDRRRCRLLAARLGKCRKTGTTYHGNCYICDAEKK